jgi:hypothetical protein
MEPVDPRGFDPPGGSSPAWSVERGTKRTNPLRFRDCSLIECRRNDREKRETKRIGHKKAQKAQKKNERV